MAVSATVLKPTARAAVPGHEMQEFVDNAIRVARSGWISDSTETLTSGVAVTVPLFDIYPGVTVVDLVMVTTIAFNGTGNNFLVGDSDDTDRFLDTTSWLSTNAGISHCVDSTGLGFKYASSDPHRINATITSSSGTNTGTCVAFLYYTVDLVDS